MNKIFDWIGDLFSKIWKLFKKILPYIMIALAVFFTFGGSFMLMGMVLEGYAAAVAAIGISFLVAPDETIDVVTGVAGSVSTAAGSIVAAGVGGLVSGLFGGGTSWLFIAAIAVGAYFLLRDNKEDDSGDSDTVGRISLAEDMTTDSQHTVDGPSVSSSQGTLGRTTV